MNRERQTHHRVGDAADLGIDGLSDVSVIGSGGSSTVYRARQSALDRVVAVKVVHAAWSMETRERFDRERRVMGGLSGHSAIVPIFQTGVTTRGEPFLVMPFYARGSLFRLMAERGPLPWREAAFIVETLSLAVADCHRRNIVHRDVKPGNVLLTDHLQPRLADFGITLAAGDESAGAAVAYTPSYSPPEAFSGGTVEATADVYGLGATLWALLAGRAPFTEQNENPEASVIVERAAAGVFRPPTERTPAPLAAFLERAMASNSQARPADAGELVAELRRAVRLSDKQRVQPSNSEGGGPEPFPVWILAALVIVGCLLIGGTALAIFAR